MKKGLRLLAGRRVLGEVALETSPDEEGIKTAAGPCCWRLPWLGDKP